MVNFGENLQEKYSDVKYGNSFNGEKGKGKECVNNKGKEEIMIHVKVRYRHSTDHRHPSPDTLHSPLLKILTQYFANSSRVSPQRQHDLLRQTSSHTLYIYIYTHTHTYIYIYIYTRARAHIHTHTHTHTHTYIYKILTTLIHRNSIKSTETNH